MKWMKTSVRLWVRTGSWLYRHWSEFQRYRMLRHDTARCPVHNRDNTHVKTRQHKMFSKRHTTWDNANVKTSFLIKIKAAYPELSDIAQKTLQPFPSTYLCETGVSTMSVMKTKYRNAIDIYSPLSVALSSIKPPPDKLANKKQAHFSH